MALPVAGVARPLATVGGRDPVVRLTIMSVRATSTLLAIVAFVGVVGIAALGADRPPPPGFLVVVAMAAGYAAGVRLLLPGLLATPRGKALVRTTLYGAACAFLFWLGTSLGVPWTPWLLVGLAVLAVLGAAFSGLLLLAGRMLAHG